MPLLPLEMGVDIIEVSCLDFKNKDISRGSRSKRSEATMERSKFDGQGWAVQFCGQVQGDLGIP